MKRHQVYVRALETQGIKVIFGKFKRKEKFCNKCKQLFETHEEKQTDVNVAIKLFQEAVNDSFDKAVIVSGDSDLIPAIKAVRESFPAKKIGIMIPIDRQAEELKATADFHYKIKEFHLKNAIFPDVVECNGAKIEIPAKWK
jgi:uncharacterized LabA/DUF88 family protein